MFLMRDSKDLSESGNVADDAYDIADVENDFDDGSGCSTEKAWQCAKHVSAIKNIDDFILISTDVRVALLVRYKKLEGF